MEPFYERNGITIYCGDCLEVMAELEPPFDAILTDLPYGTTACEWDSVIPFEPLWENVRRLLKRTGAFVTTASQPFTSALVMSNPEWFRDEWIYSKNKSTRFLDAKIRPMKSHENIIVFCKNLPNYYPQMDYVGIKDKRKQFSSKVGDVDYLRGGLTIYSHSRDNGYRYPKTIIQINNANTVNSLHPTQKPLALYQYLTRTYTNPGELILDPTMGSGTTLVAAQNEGRRAIGIELCEEYCRIAVDRLRQPSLFSLPIQPAAVSKPEQAAMEL